MNDFKAYLKLMSFADDRIAIITNNILAINKHFLSKINIYIQNGTIYKIDKVIGHSNNGDHLHI